MIKEKITTQIIMENAVYDKLVKAIKHKNPAYFIKALVDFYEDNKVKMPRFIRLHDYLRYNTNTYDEKIIFNENNTGIILHKQWDDIFDMEWFIKNYSSGIYQYKNKIFHLKNMRYSSYDGDDNLFPYLETVADLNNIKIIKG